MFVTGISKTKFGILKKSVYELAYEAIYNSLEDNGLSLEDIDAIFVSNFLGDLYESQLHLNSVIAGLIPGFNRPIIRIETACASGGSAVYTAIMSLNRFKNVLVLGIEKMSGAENLSGTRFIGMAGDRVLDQSKGLIFPANYALLAQQHMLKYGTTHEDLERVSFKAHSNARLNPLAHFNYKKVTKEMIKNAPMVCSPLSLYDCSPISDGASAIILSQEKIHDYDPTVNASALAVDSISLVQREDLTSFKSAKIASKKAFSQAGIKPKDLSIAFVHDCFTIAELVAMEDIGLCKPGESKDWVRVGRTALDGDIPINPDGGLKAGGHPIGASGVSQIVEAVKQLRGEAGKYQVNDVEHCLAHNIGGIGGTAAVHILSKD